MSNNKVSEVSKAKDRALLAQKLLEIPGLTDWEIMTVINHRWRTFLNEAERSGKVLEEDAPLCDLFKPDEVYIQVYDDPAKFAEVATIRHHSLSDMSEGEDGEFSSREEEVWQRGSCILGDVKLGYSERSTETWNGKIVSISVRHDTAPTFNPERRQIIVTREYFWSDFDDPVKETIWIIHIFLGLSVHPENTLKKRGASIPLVKEIAQGATVTPLKYVTRSVGIGTLGKVISLDSKTCTVRFQVPVPDETSFGKEECQVYFKDLDCTLSLNEVLVVEEPEIDERLVFVEFQYDTTLVKWQDYTGWRSPTRDWILYLYDPERDCHAYVNCGHSSGVPYSGVSSPLEVVNAGEHLFEVDEYDQIRAYPSWEPGYPPMPKGWNILTRERTRSGEYTTVGDIVNPAEHLHPLHHSLSAAAAKLLSQELKSNPISVGTPKDWESLHKRIPELPAENIVYQWQSRLEVLDFLSKAEGTIAYSASRVGKGLDAQWRAQVSATPAGDCLTYFFK